MKHVSNHINLHIKKITLHGIGKEEAEKVEVAIADELKQLIARRGDFSFESQDKSLGNIQIQASKPHLIGRQIAAHIYRALLAGGAHGSG